MPVGVQTLADARQAAAPCSDKASFCIYGAERNRLLPSRVARPSWVPCMWQQSRGVPEVPTPLVYDGRIYVVRNGGIVHCRDPSDGGQLFRGRLGAIGGYYASPVAADGKIYFDSERGVVTVLASGDRLDVLARNKLGEPIMATPALVDGKIYVRTDVHLYAFGAGF